MTVLAGFAGMLVAGGAWLAAVSWRPVVVTRSNGGWAARFGSLDVSRVATAAGCGLLALVLTRWPIAALAAAVGGWVAAGWRGRRQARRQVEGRGEAVALWAEMLRDALGTSRGIEGVLTATAAGAPVAIRPQVQRMARRLRDEPLEGVLDGLADDLGDPVGDVVVEALRQAALTGGSQLREVLADLAAAAYGQAQAQRRVAIARERPRAAMRYTAAVIAGFVVLLMVFSRSYLQPYDTTGGQAVLAFVGVYWVVGLWWMAHMSQTPAPLRVLRTDTEAGR